MTNKTIQQESKISIEAAVSMWVELVLAHVRAKSLEKKKSTKVFKKHRYAAR